jgi:hypothetical protein
MQLYWRPKHMIWLPNIVLLEWLDAASVAYKEMALPIIDALIRRPLFLGKRPTATSVGYKS